MINSERKFDWFSLVIGILWVILGAAAINSPSTAISVIAVFVGIGALAKGIYTLWLRRAIQMLTGSNSKMTLLIISSVVDIILGIIFLFRIHFGFGIIAYLFAFWFIFDSILQLVIDNYCCHYSNPPSRLPRNTASIIAIRMNTPFCICLTNMHLSPSS